MKDRTATIIMVICCFVIPISILVFNIFILPKVVLMKYFPQIFGTILGFLAAIPLILSGLR